MEYLKISFDNHLIICKIFQIFVRRKKIGCAYFDTPYTKN